MKKAFTLAEVLITLGIIGVVAALTIPTLVNNYRKKQFETGLKKEYSVLLQALDMYKQDNETPLKKEDTDQLHAEFKNKIKPYLKILVDCGDSQAGGSEAKCVQNGNFTQDKKYTYKTYSGNIAKKDLFDDGQIILNDGSHLLFENPGGGNDVYVSIDVNGYKKLPNKWGEDVFTFQLMNDGKLLPMGAEGTRFRNTATYCSKTSSNVYNGIACANRAIYDSSFWK